MIDKFTDDDLKRLFLEIKNSDAWNSNYILQKLKDLNPWKEINDLSGDKDFPAIIPKDSILIDLLKKNIEENKSKIESLNIEENQKSLLKELLETLIKSPFQDYEQAFDGNLINPKVLVLGINPRFDYGHPEYGLLDFYKQPFDSNRVPLHKRIDGCRKRDILVVEQFRIHKKDYYFGESAFFYKSPEENEDDSLVKEVYDAHRKVIFDEKSETPFALLEFFPYASDDENTWVKLGSLDNVADGLEKYDGIANISETIKSYLKLEKLLYSQQWMLCVIAFLIKNNPNIIIYLRKNNEEFRGIFDEFLKKLPKVTVYSKIAGISQKISLNNTKNYKTGQKLKESGAFKDKSNIDFFKWLWKIEEETP